MQMYQVWYFQQKREESHCAKHVECCVQLCLRVFKEINLNRNQLKNSYKNYLGKRDSV